MKNLNVILVLFSLLAVSCSAQKAVEFNFEKEELGKIPNSWTKYLTGNGKMCSWEIVDDSENKVFAQTSQNTNDYRFNVAVNNDFSYKNIEISVKFKAIAGEVDRGGGLVWRFIDENNYYVARANPLENNFRVYKVVNGDRKKLKSAKVKMKSNIWYDIKITMDGDKIKCYFNGKLELETTDDTFSKKGKVGLWTKSDAQTYFDNLIVGRVQ